MACTDSQGHDKQQQTGKHREDVACTGTVMQTF